MLNVFIVYLYNMTTCCKESEFKLNHSNWVVDSASKRNEYNEYFLVDKGGRSARLTNLSTFMCWFTRPLRILRDCPVQYEAALPYHSNGVIFEILIVKYVQKIYGHILNRIPIHGLVSHSNRSYVRGPECTLKFGLAGHVPSAATVSFCSLCYYSLMVERLMTDKLARKISDLKDKH